MKACDEMGGEGDDLLVVWKAVSCRKSCLELQKVHPKKEPESTASNLIEALTDACLSESAAFEMGNLRIILPEASGFLIKTAPESSASNWAV